MQSHDINYTDQWLWLEKHKNNPWMFPMEMLQLVCCLNVNEKQRLLSKVSGQTKITFLQTWSCQCSLATQFYLTDIRWGSRVCCQNESTENQTTTLLSHPCNYPPAFPKHLFALLCKSAAQLCPELSQCPQGHCWNTLLKSSLAFQLVPLEEINLIFSYASTPSCL